jgi:hypothetical protein
MRPDTICETEPGSRPSADAEFRWPGFQWTVLQRHGKRPLAVLGRVLLRANNRCAGLPNWSEITIHETAGLRFAASLRHQPAEGDAVLWCDAWLCDTPEAIWGVFHRHDPLWALPLASGAVSFDTMTRDAAQAQRFRGAWAGLLAAVFGLPPPRRLAP